jgi:ArsR family transcriptional regulator, lead/cadmium/zinc/bismuth-responsive transcriptional repressor
MPLKKKHSHLASDPHGNASQLALMQGFINHTDQFQGVVDGFKHLSDINRVRIFWLMCHAELCTACIAELMDMSSPAVAHHVKLLRESGLIEGRREGKEVRYRAVNSVQARTLHEAIERMLAINCPASSI